MVKLEGGSFLMGGEAPETSPDDGEGPVRRVTLAPFHISKFAVSNERFGEFIRASGYRTEAERAGWSFVFRNHVPEESRGPATPGTPLWVRVEGADWAHPEGPDSSIAARPHHPAVQVPGTTQRLTAPGLDTACPPKPNGNTRRAAAWGRRLTRGAMRSTLAAGTCATSGRDRSRTPVSARMASPVPRRWIASRATASGSSTRWAMFGSGAAITSIPLGTSLATPAAPVGPPSGTERVMKGGSYLCHAAYCWRYRNAARTGAQPDTATGHIGFRAVRDV